MVSKIVLVTIRSTTLPFCLIPQLYNKVWAVTHTMGISVDSSAANSSLSSPAGVTAGSYTRMAARRLLPTCLVFSQLKKQCSRLAWVGVGQCLQFSEEFGRILATLSSVGRILWRSFHRKLVASEPKPFSLALLQVNSQSVPGDANSDLELMYSMVLFSSMMTSCSSSTLYHCAVDIVATFKGVFSLTHLMELKKEIEKYGGMGGGLEMESSCSTYTL